MLSRRLFFNTALASAVSAQDVRLPDQIRWQPDDPPGAKYAILYGDRDKPGSLFSYAFWLPGGVWAPAHYHSQDAHVTVVRGTLKLGHGRQVDKSKVVSIPTGGFFLTRAGWHARARPISRVLTASA